MSQWYYADANGGRQGPVDGSDLARWLGERRLRWDTLVWRDGMAGWQPMSDFADEFNALAAGAAPGAAAGIATPTTPSATVAASSPTDTPAQPFAVARADSPYAPPSAPLLAGSAVHHGHDVVYAGFWKRMAAYVVDGLIMGVASYAVQIPLFIAVFGTTGFSGGTPDFGNGMTALALVAAYLVPIVIQMLYYAWFHASGRQATPGKMAVGIKVVNETGAPISFARGIGRYFAFLLSGFTLGIGYAMAGFTDRKRGLHDMVASTLVVDRWAYTDRPELQRRELGTVAIVILVLGALLLVGFTMVLIGLAASLGAASR